MKVPDKYEPKNADEFGPFDRAMDKILAIPGSAVQKKIKKETRVAIRRAGQA